MPEGYQGVVFVNEISNKFIKDLAATNFEIGQKVKLEILSINHTNKKASLSFKNVNTDFDIQITSTNTHKLVTKKQTQSTKKINTYVLQATLNGFDNLKKAADKEIEEK
ncbi:general stress protein 13 [Chlamydia trachomatis]|nr:general stress protein 13 [Chlamydia trachomatis]